MHILNLVLLSSNDLMSEEVGERSNEWRKTISNLKIKKKNYVIINLH